MVFKHAIYLGADRNGLHRIAEQVADHAYSASLRDFDENGEIRPMLPKCRM